MKKFFNEIDPGIFLPPAIIVVIITVLAIAIPVQFSAAMGAALTWILDELGWFMGLVVLMMFFICCFAMFSKYGRIKLGGASSKPLMSTGSWIALSFTSAMAIGISFWGTAEPMMHFATPAAMDGVEAYSIGAAQASMNWTFHHWGPVFFAMYCGAGVMVAFATQNNAADFEHGIGPVSHLWEPADQHPCHHSQQDTGYEARTEQPQGVKQVFPNVASFH